MSKIRIYRQGNFSSQNLEIVDKEIVHKLRHVLRIATGDSVYVFDGLGKEFIFQVKNLSRNILFLENGKLIANQPIPSKKTILAFPLLKEDKIDFILQKATELGVLEFWPFSCKRSLSVEVSQKKYIRWRKIIIEAARQSGRLWLPELRDVKGFEALSNASIKSRFVASVNGEPLTKYIGAIVQEVLLVVGPEGDFAKDENETFSNNGFCFVKFSDHLLRTETAAIYGAGVFENII